MLDAVAFRNVGFFFLCQFNMTFLIKLATTSPQFIVG
jgi:hypothetical protein